MRLALRRTNSNVLRFVGLTVCLLAANLSTAAQDAPRPAPASEKPVPPQFRVLTLKEARAIVNAAWSHRLSGDGIEDCSHIVNQIYGNAGYDYPYASSFDLYRGTSNFVRVKSPQPGDLIAWPGHVGIVLNPKHHSFYSLVSTGLEAQNYRGAYWRGRGTPRFYRYLVENSVQDATRLAGVPRNGEAQGTARAARTSQDTPELTAASVIEKQIDKDARSASRSHVAAGRSAPVGPQPNSATAVSAETGDAPSPAPTSAFIETAGAHPTRDEVAESILSLANSAAESLIGADVLKPGTPVIIVEQLSVERVEIKRDRGWAHLKMDSRVSLGADGASFKTRHDKVRWELRRGETGWTATIPQDRTYISRDAAVRVLSARLAQLSSSDAAAQHDEAVLGQEARLANLLSALLGTR
jgi:hypothetical protein